MHSVAFPLLLFILSLHIRCLTASFTAAIFKFDLLDATALALLFRLSNSVIVAITVAVTVAVDNAFGLFGFIF